MRDKILKAIRAELIALFCTVIPDTENRILVMAKKPTLSYRVGFYNSEEYTSGEFVKKRRMLFSLQYLKNFTHIQVGKYLNRWRC